MVVAEDALARVPDGSSLEEAATLPMNGLTVRLALDLLALTPGQTLAVTGSAGIVGQFALQLGRHEGLTVIGDAAPAEIELIERSAPTGWSRAARARSRRPRDYPDGVDAIIDAALPARGSAPSAAAASCGGPPIRGADREREGRAGIAVHLVPSASTCTRATASPNSSTWCSKGV